MATQSTTKERRRTEPYPLSTRPAPPRFAAVGTVRHGTAAGSDFEVLPAGTHPLQGGVVRSRLSGAVDQLRDRTQFIHVIVEH